MSDVLPYFFEEILLMVNMDLLNSSHPELSQINDDVYFD